jgi:hypothetical protein
MLRVEQLQYEEFSQNFSQRLQESDLVIGGIFSTLMKFHESHAAGIAVRLPVIIKNLGNISVEVSGKHKSMAWVDYAPVDEDFKELPMRSRPLMTSGLYAYRKTDQCPRLTLNNGYVAYVAAGYFMGQVDEIDLEHLTFTTTMELGSDVVCQA